MKPEKKKEDKEEKKNKEEEESTDDDASETLGGKKIMSNFASIFFTKASFFFSPFFKLKYSYFKVNDVISLAKLVFMITLIIHMGKVVVAGRGKTIFQTFFIGNIGINNIVTISR